MTGPRVTLIDSMLPLGSFCDVVNYVGDNLAGPVLAAIVAGVLIPLFFRAFAIPKEVADHDARAVEFNMNLRRWVCDRDRQLQRELRTLVNQAGSGVASRFPVPRSEHPPPGTGSQLYAGALENEAVAGMRQALHEYRDEASSRVSEYCALARSEGPWHRWYRKWEKRPTINFWVRDEEREILEEWRRRPHPVEKDKWIGIDVLNDPTVEPDIGPLEEGPGLTWEKASTAHFL